LRALELNCILREGRKEVVDASGWLLHREGFDFISLYDLTQVTAFVTAPAVYTSNTISFCFS
jgi:hypothetical protein